MRRNIVQIAFAADCPTAGYREPGETLVALCNDGTVWAMWKPMNEASSWFEIASIPQPSGSASEGSPE